MDEIIPVLTFEITEEGVTKLWSYLEELEEDENFEDLKDVIDDLEYFELDEAILDTIRDGKTLVEWGFDPHGIDEGEYWYYETVAVMDPDVPLVFQVELRPKDRTIRLLEWTLPTLEHEGLIRNVRHDTSKYEKALEERIREWYKSMKLNLDLDLVDPWKDFVWFLEAHGGDFLDKVEEKALVDLLEEEREAMKRVKVTRENLQVLPGEFKDLTLRDYQHEQLRTANPSLDSKDRLLNAVLGIAGETGELVEAIKHHVFHKHDLDVENVIEELGDLLWYLSELASTLDVTLDEVAGVNVRKLRKRYPDGFTPEDSINRKI